MMARCGRCIKGAPAGRAPRRPSGGRNSVIGPPAHRTRGPRILRDGTAGQQSRRDESHQGEGSASGTVDTVKGRYDGNHGQGQDCENSQPWFSSYRARDGGGETRNEGGWKSEAPGGDQCSVLSAFDCSRASSPRKTVHWQLITSPRPHSRKSWTHRRADCYLPLVFQIL
jgi:hypothetical protein